jgi:hypothetical protein
VPLALFQYWSDKLPDPASHRLYMDYGTETLDALYPVHQQFLMCWQKKRATPASII